ncbi:MAG: carboxypeptidase regulatory-like domain-containing protein [Deltaproteobacteria bacterium]|nr:MAG: carboxypeptidase regulatory-like domain-containing protein [Deltaproteobacteria bacterium]TMQ07283.1 MAG: carboxypeptidase regulatory-like domain-containing protein [Deltaproteobacteria bacterium]
MGAEMRFIVIVSLVSALTGCGDNLNLSGMPETPPMSRERATVTGHVVDASGAPVAGATVVARATGERATVDGSGAFVLDVPANTTLTLAATGPSMATTLLQQFMISPDASAAFEIPLVTGDHIRSLVAMGPNTSGGAIAISLKSLSGASISAPSATVELTPSNLGAVLYAPSRGKMPDPDPSLTSIAGVAWALGVQPHVSIMKLTLHGMPQVEPPYAIDDVMWPGTFTVDAGALTLVTLVTP